MSLKPLVLDEGGGKQHTTLPRELVTGTGVEPRPRLRVDVAQTAFWEGRMFRSYIELNVAAGATFAARFTAVGDFILHKQEIALEDGQLRFSAATGGTPGGTFTNRPAIGMNRMGNRPLPLYAATAALASGGTHTGGVEVEVIRLKAASATAQTSTVGAESDSDRGLPAGEYFLRFQNAGSGTLTGVYTLEWEEWAPRSPEIY